MNATATSASDNHNRSEEAVTIRSESCDEDQQRCILGWTSLAVILVVCVPLFVCMPLTNDVVLYDMQARNLLRGGLLYRDILEPNFPGIVWMHAAIRSMVGWSSEAFRSVDLLLYSGTVWLLTSWLPHVGIPRRHRIWLAVALFLYYFSLSEWNHGQRDIWMLLPAMGALHLRRKQMERLAKPETTAKSILLGSVLEGLCWSSAVWIKPHIVFPAAACWLVSAFFVRRFRTVSLDLAALVVTGLAVGGAGLAWLHLSGTWPYFLDMQLNWNPRYFKAGKEHWQFIRVVAIVMRSFPWHCVQPLAVICAGLTIATTIRRGRLHTSSNSVVEASASQEIQFQHNRCLIAVFYLSWLVQVLLLQHLFDYVYTPTAAIALTVLAVEIGRRPCTSWVPWKSWRPWVCLFLLIAVCCMPLWRNGRLSLWTLCFQEGSTPRVRDRLRVLVVPLYEELEKVQGFLREQDVQDGEVVCYNDFLVPIYFDLDLKPPSRFVYIDQLLMYFYDQDPEKDKRLELFRELKKSPQRFVIVDLWGSGFQMPKEALAAGETGPHSPPPMLDTSVKNLYPWSYPIVFRAGPYLVYKVEGPMGRLRYGAPRKNPERAASPKNKI